MSSIKNLKKDINFVLGDIIEAVYIWEVTANKQNSDEGSQLIDDTISKFDELIEKVNDRTVENRASHLKQVNKDLEEAAGSLIERLNQLS